MEVLNKMISCKMLKSMFLHVSNESTQIYRVKVNKTILPFGEKQQLAWIPTVGFQAFWIKNFNHQ